MVHNKSANMKLYSTKEKYYFLKGKVGAKELTISVTMSIIAMASVIGVRS